MLKTAYHWVTRGIVARPGVRDRLRALHKTGYVPDRFCRSIPVVGSFEVQVGTRSFAYDAGVGDRIANPLYWFGLRGYEPETFEAVLPLMRSADSFIDVGSYTGLFSLVAAVVADVGSVVAIEPVSENAARIHQNIRINDCADSITVVEAAASDARGNALFGGPTSLLPDNNTFVDSPAKSTRRVRTVTLDEVAEDLRVRVDLVKIDVEGSEPDVLRGAYRILTEDRPDLLIEVLPSGPGDRIQEILDPLGYRYFQLTSTGPLPVDELRGRSHDVGRNFLCQPRA